jgi:hypothetical protein
VKNVLLGDDSCHVPFLSDTYEGSCHDKRIADQTAYPLPEGSELLQDLGFVGFTLDGVAITMPLGTATRWRTECRAESGKPSDCPSPSTSRTHHLLDQTPTDCKRHAEAMEGHST